MFGPATYRENGSIDLQIEQGIMIINEIMRTMCTPGHSQDILQLFLRTFQHASNLSKPLLEYPNQRAPHLEGHYYVYLSKFLAENKMQIEFASVTSHKLEQEKDVFLIDKACAKTKEKLSDPIIRTINYCRSYFEVKCLSDICTAYRHYTLPLVLQVY